LIGYSQKSVIFQSSQLKKNQFMMLGQVEVYFVRLAIAVRGVQCLY